MSTKYSEFPVSLFLLVKNLSLELSLKNKTFSLRRQLVGTNYLTTSVCNPAAHWNHFGNFENYWSLAPLLTNEIRFLRWDLIVAWGMVLESSPI